MDAVDAALVGGALTGAGLGAVQWWAADGALGRAAAWIGASAVGYAVGLAAGAALVGYDTDLGSLAIMGLVSGAALGAAQGLVLAREGRRGLALPWALAMPVLFALGWSCIAPVSASTTSSRCSAPPARCCSCCSAASCSRVSPPPARRRRDGRRRPCRARRRRCRDGRRRGARPAWRVGARRQPLRAARADGGRAVRDRDVADPVSRPRRRAALGSSTRRSTRRITAGPQEFPGLQAAAIAAAQAAGARLVAMDNVYMYGRPMDGRSPRTAPTTPTPARAASAPRWPAT